MHALKPYDYAIVRLVPRVERQEFINVGVIVSCPEADFLDAQIELDERRVHALFADVDLDVVKEHLASIPRICHGGAAAGPIGKLQPRERFHWLVAPRSTIIQTSAVHTGRCTDPAGLLERMMQTMVRTPQPSDLT